MNGRAMQSARMTTAMEDPTKTAFDDLDNNGKITLLRVESPIGQYKLASLMMHACSSKQMLPREKRTVPALLRRYR